MSSSKIFAFAPSDQIALAAACELASFHQKGWPCVKLSRLASNLKISDRKSHEAMDRLQQLTLVQSVRGPSGGYRLSIAWDCIRVSHVLRESLRDHHDQAVHSLALERIASAFGEQWSSLSDGLLLKDLLGDRPDIERHTGDVHQSALVHYSSLADSMRKPLVTSVFDLAGQVEQQRS